MEQKLRKAGLLKALERARLYNVAPAIALEILSTYDGDITCAELENLDTSAKRTDDIDRLYTELRDLRTKAAEDPALEDEIKEKLSRLRQLQAEEASEMRKRFRAWLPFEPGSGRTALERAKRLLADGRTSA